VPLWSSFFGTGDCACATALHKSANTAVCIHAMIRRGFPANHCGHCGNRTSNLFCETWQVVEAEKIARANLIPAPRGDGSDPFAVEHRPVDG
jgi:hypothetical protein